MQEFLIVKIILSNLNFTEKVNSLSNSNFLPDTKKKIFFHSKNIISRSSVITISWCRKLRCGWLKLIWFSLGDKNSRYSRCRNSSLPILVSLKYGCLTAEDFTSFAIHLMNPYLTLLSDSCFASNFRVVRRYETTRDHESFLMCHVPRINLSNHYTLQTQYYHHWTLENVHFFLIFKF